MSYPEPNSDIALDIAVFPLGDSDSRCYEISGETVLSFSFLHR